MLQLAGLVAVAVSVIVAVAYWSLRSGDASDGSDNYDESGVLDSSDTHHLDDRPVRVDNRPIRRPAPQQAPRMPAGSGTGWQPAVEQQPFTPPNGVRTERQGDAVAKSRLRMGLADRVGWRRGTDVDAEMWPEEQFGGVSDEQFWDDLASDKPLATTARTAQTDGGPPQSRQRPSDQRPDGKRLGEVRPANRTAPLPGQTATQAFPVVGSPSTQATGPQPIRPVTQPVRATTQPQPALPAAMPALPALQPTHQQPQPTRSRAATQPQPQPLPTPQPLPLPSGPNARPAAGRGRHSSGEDPLTSAAYSLRSNSGVDGRSYQASRRARELPRDQYEAAAPTGNGNGNGSTGAHRSVRQDPRDTYAATGNGSGGYPYQYGQPGPAAPLTQTPPYGENYGYAGGSDDPGWGSGARDYTPRPSANGARGDSRDSSRADRDRDRDRELPAYQAGYPGPYDSRGTDRR